MKHFSTWFAAIFAAAVVVDAPATEPLKEPGAMLRQGTWDGGIGTFHTPEAFAALDPTQWPMQGWQRLRLFEKHIESAPVAAPRKEVPAFLKAITEQVVRGEVPVTDAGAGAGAGSNADPAIAAEEQSFIYLRVPGVRWRAGRIPVHLFKSGTPQLRPKLDHRYELSLGSQAFAMTVRNGLRGRNGEPYGDGAYYTIEYGGATYEYRLDGYGWDSWINAIADVDGDGKPDFFINVGGSNSGTEYWILSTKARPGRNPATASLRSTGC